MDISLKALQEAVSIRRQIDTLERRLSSILSLPHGPGPGRGPRLTRPMPGATRAKLAAAARARWAKKAGSKTTPAKKKGGITPVGRKRLSQLMKARWATRTSASSPGPGPGRARLRRS
jgi:hypothetical protein